MRMKEHSAKTRTVHSTVQTTDMIQIFGKSPSGWEIPEDAEIEIVEGPIPVRSSDGELIDAVRIRHFSADRNEFLEAYIPYSFVK
jgi:hypothetical protein